MSTKRMVAREKDCGIIMPISTFKVNEVTYTESYWKGVLSFLVDSIEAAGFNPVVAWESDKSDVIHSKIVSNINKMPLMVGVLVGTNPNVMLECGMRLWTRKPLLLLVADNVEKIPFDISPVNCLRFPVDCNYGKLKSAKKEIRQRLKEMASDGYKSILSHFLDVEPSETEAVDRVSLSKFMAETRREIEDIKQKLNTQVAMSGSWNYPVLPSLSGVGFNSPSWMNDLRRLSSENSGSQTGPTGPTYTLGM